MNRFYIITNCEQEEDFHHLSGFNFSEIIYSVRSHDLLVKILIGYDLYDKKRKPPFLLVTSPFTWKKMTMEKISESISHHKNPHPNHHRAIPFLYF